MRESQFGEQYLLDRSDQIIERPDLTSNIWSWFTNLFKKLFQSVQKEQISMQQC